MNPLEGARRLGQGVWLDYLRRGLIASGELAELIEAGLSGVTSNPTIFEKAIAGSRDYDEQLRALIAEGREVEAIFEGLAVEDIRAAADLLAPVYDKTEGRDGFVSLEVSPRLAHDTEGTIEAARRLWRAVGRPNVMIKVPATPPGIPAIERLIADGVNVNVTLIFSIERYEAVAEAYLAGLERRLREGQPIDRVASVASFFLSRVDSLVDKRLQAKLREAGSEDEAHRLEALLGKAAIANAKLAYARFRAIFAGPRWATLASRGARVQRPLWASPGTKNPAYSDLHYLEPLIGPDTVTTLPPATLEAFRDHGRVRATLEEGLPEAEATVRELAAAGVDLDQVTRRLEEEGVKAFADSFDALFACIQAKRDLLRSGLLAAWLLAAVPALTELTLSVILWSAGNETIGVMAFNLHEEGKVLLSAALATLIVAASLGGRADGVRPGGGPGRIPARPPPGDGRIQPLPRGPGPDLRPGARLPAAPRPGLHRPGGHPGRPGTGPAPAHPLHRGQQVGDHAGGPCLPPVLLRPGAGGERRARRRAVRRHHRPRDASRSHRPGAGVPPGLPESSGHRRPVLRPLLLRPRPRGPAGARPGPAPRPRGADGPGVRRVRPDPGEPGPLARRDPRGAGAPRAGQADLALLAGAGRLRRLARAARRREHGEGGAGDRPGGGRAARPGGPVRGGPALRLPPTRRNRRFRAGRQDQAAGEAAPRGDPSPGGPLRSRRRVLPLGFRHRRGRRRARGRSVRPAQRPGVEGPHARPP
ncbi:MAG: transaldolase [Candidatus Rokubacteria bacterium]|nr:transaldolase [Candidatus Rokubacteria bacterium]